MTEQITMSQREVDRLQVIQAVTSGQMLQREAAGLLSLSVRQIKRLVQRYRSAGAAGLVSRHRGKVPNNAFSPTTRKEIMALVRATYADFGPTLACEKLAECHQHQLSAETLRQWMMAEGLWQAKRRRQARIHQRRPRRSCLGELVQIDGSPHDWFEGRAPRCTLLVYIDDATGRLLLLSFVLAETTAAYMTATRQYLSQYGRPVAFYSDKHSVFRVNHPDHDGELTQFSRALKTLDIEPIHAHTPQAKGRVERANQTLQDRLVKEMRLKGISSMEQANAFMPIFIEAYNKRFAVAPRSKEDAHRPVLHDADELALIFSVHHRRKLSKNLCLQFKNQEYQLQGYGNGYRFRGATVTVCEAFDGTVTLLHDGKPLTYRLLLAGEPPLPLDDEKSIHHTVDRAKASQRARGAYKPSIDHPWKAGLKRRNHQAASA